MKRIGILGTTILFAVFGFTVKMQAQDQHDKDAAPEKHEEAKPAEHHDDNASKPEKQDAKPQEQQRHDDDKAAKENEHQQQDKDAEKAAKDQQKNQEKAAEDQEKQQKDQQKQSEQEEKAAQHNQQNNNNQRRNGQPVSDQQRQDNQRTVDQQRAGQQRGQQDNRPSSQRGNTGEQRTTWQAHRASNWKSQHRDWQQRGGYQGYHIPDDRFRASFGEGHHFHLASYPVEVVEGFPRFQINGFWFALVDPWPEFWADDWYETDDCYIDYYDGGYYLEDVRYPGVRLAINVFVG